MSTIGLLCAGSCFLRPFLSGNEGERNYFMQYGRKDDKLNPTVLTIVFYRFSNTDFWFSTLPWPCLALVDPVLNFARTFFKMFGQSSTVRKELQGPVSKEAAANKRVSAFIEILLVVASPYASAMQIVPEKLSSPNCMGAMSAGSVAGGFLIRFGIGLVFVLVLQ